MQSLERRRFPEWAEKERAGDLAWIKENWHIFWPAGQQGYREFGRGGIVVDTTSRPTGAGNPFVYLPETGVEKLKDPDALRMVREYDPTWDQRLLGHPGTLGHYRKTSICRSKTEQRKRRTVE